MGFRDQLRSEANKRFAGFSIEDEGLEKPLVLRSVLMLSEKEQKRLDGYTKELHALQNEEGVGVDKLTSTVCKMLQVLADDAKVAQKYFSDFTVAELLLTYETWVKETQADHSKSAK